MRIALTTLFAMIALAVPGQAAAKLCAHPGKQRLASLPHQYPFFYRQLRASFGAYWREAAVVSYGEGSWHRDASNGQYKGTFQMGSSERDRYGHGPTLAEQVRAASKYFWRSLRERGYRWAPWECKPYGV